MNVPLYADDAKLVYSSAKVLCHWSLLWVGTQDELFRAQDNWQWFRLVTWNREISLQLTTRTTTWRRNEGSKIVIYIVYARTMSNFLFYLRIDCPWSKYETRLLLLNTSITVCDGSLGHFCKQWWMIMVQVVYNISKLIWIILWLLFLPIMLRSLLYYKFITNTNEMT